MALAKNEEATITLFESFLKDMAAYQAYLRNFREVYRNNEIDNFQEFYREALKNSDPEVWVCEPFEWDSTNEGLKYWQKISLKWLEVLKDFKDDA